MRPSIKTSKPTGLIVTRGAAPSSSGENQIDVVSQRDLNFDVSRIGGLQRNEDDW